MCQQSDTLYISNMIIPSDQIHLLSLEKTGGLVNTTDGLYSKISLGIKSTIVDKTFQFIKECDCNITVSNIFSRSDFKALLIMEMVINM